MHSYKLSNISVELLMSFIGNYLFHWQMVYE